MTRNFERKVIYAVYLLLILWAALSVARAVAWELKVEDGRAVSPKECKACLADFAGCMDLVDKMFAEEDDPVEPKEYVAAKLSCVIRAEKCGIDNKCKTRVERTEK